MKSCTACPVVSQPPSASLRQGVLFLPIEKTYTFLKVLKGLVQSYPAYIGCSNVLHVDATGRMWVDCYVPGHRSQHHTASPDPDHDTKLKLTPPLPLHIADKEVNIQQAYYQSARKLTLETPEGEAAITFDVII